MKMPGNAQRVFNVYAVHKYITRWDRDASRWTAQAVSLRPVCPFEIGSLGDVVESGFVSLRDS